jgi:hypothetical protein
MAKDFKEMLKNDYHGVLEILTKANIKIETSEVGSIPNHDGEGTIIYCNLEDIESSENVSFFLQTDYWSGDLEPTIGLRSGIKPPKDIEKYKLLKKENFFTKTELETVYIYKDLKELCEKRNKNKSITEQIWISDIVTINEAIKDVKKKSKKEFSNIIASNRKDDKDYITDIKKELYKKYPNAIFNIIDTTKDFDLIDIRFSYSNKNNFKKEDFEVWHSIVDIDFIIKTVEDNLKRNGIRKKIRIKAKDETIEGIEKEKVYLNRTKKEEEYSNLYDSLKEEFRILGEDKASRKANFNTIKFLNGKNKIKEETTQKQNKNKIISKNF